MTTAFSELLDDIEDRERLIDEAVRRNTDRATRRRILRHPIEHWWPSTVGCIRREYRRLLAERAAAYAVSQEQAMGPR